MTWLYVSMSAMLLKGVNTNTVFVMSNIADILQRSPVDFSGSRVTCLVLSVSDWCVHLLPTPYLL
jgi:hypothetical protein